MFIKLNCKIMAECDFSWFKVLSFFGATALAVLCFVMLGFGISNITSGEAAYGVACILAGALSACVAVWTYRNYQKKKSE